MHEQHTHLEGPDRARRAVRLIVLSGSLVFAACNPALEISPQPSIPLIGQNDVAEATRFRQAFGLRADEAWIRIVAADPASEPGHRTFGVPLLPSEVDDLLARASRTDDIVPIVEQYGAAVPEDWAGVYIDQGGGGTVVARFHANVDRHRAAVEAILPADARVEVRSAAWSRTELQVFIERVSAESAWFPTVGLELEGAEIAVADNLVDVRFRGDPSLSSTVAEHFGMPPWLRPVWAGPREWTGPRGDLLIVVTDGRGDPAAGLDVTYQPADPLVGGSGDIGYRTDDEGQLLLRNHPAVRYEVVIRAKDGEDLVVVATGSVEVKQDEQTVLRLETRPRP